MHHFSGMGPSILHPGFQHLDGETPIPGFEGLRGFSNQDQMMAFL